MDGWYQSQRSLELYGIHDEELQFILKHSDKYWQMLIESSHYASDHPVIARLFHAVEWRLAMIIGKYLGVNLATTLPEQSQVVLLKEEKAAVIIHTYFYTRTQ